MGRKGLCILILSVSLAACAAGCAKKRDGPSTGEEPAAEPARGAPAAGEHARQVTPPAAAKRPRAQPIPTGAALTIAAPQKMSGSALAELVAGGKAAAYSPATGAVACAACSSSEGVGKGCWVSFAPGQEGQQAGELTLYEPDEDSEEALKKTLPSLTARLKKESFMVLRKVPWGQERELSFVGGLSILLDGGKLRVRRSGKEIASATPEVDEGYTLEPQAAFLSAGVPVVVVLVEHDPGEAYFDGLNRVQSCVVLRVPGL